MTDDQNDNLSVWSIAADTADKTGGEDRLALATAARVEVLGEALETMMACWLASTDGNRAAALLRDLEAASAQAAARAPVDALQRDAYLLELDKFGGGFFERLHRRSEEIRAGHGGVRR